MKVRILSLALTAALLLSVWPAAADGAETAAVPASAAQASGQTPRYVEYVRELTGKPAGAAEAAVEGEAGTVLEGEAEILTGSRFSGGSALRTEEGSVVEWTVTAPSSGVYTLSLTVGTSAAKKSAAQRSLSIDGQLLFDELQELTFTRCWRDVLEGESFSRDSQGNQLRPDAGQADVLEEQSLRAASGDAYRLYLEAGEHVLRLEASKERLVIDSLRLSPPAALPSYAQREEEYAQKGYAYASQPLPALEAEYTSAKSDYSIYPVFDRTSAATSPQDTASLMLNTIGGSNWQTDGQWIEWTVEVEESGLYQLAFRYKQDGLRGVFVSRELSIDGEVPFAEASRLRFPYGNKWQVMTAGDEEGNPFAFYLSAGSHTIRLRVVLGDLYGIVEQVSGVLTRLNSIYRSILSITGSKPDIYRDYDFEHLIPEVLADMESQSASLKDAAARLYDLTGQTGEMSSMLETMYFQLDKMLEKPYEIAKQFATFKSNISSLGDWVFQISSQPLLLDTLELTVPDAPRREAEAGFFRQLAFNAELFLNSFLIDYNTAGQGADPLVVWVPTGRDQWQIISTLADNRFTTETGIPVSVRLVAPTALLPSALSGRGPDAALSNAQNIAVDYALRGAVLDLSGFEDADEVLARFTESAAVPLQYGGGLYGLPESQTWPMLFCRTDVLEELGAGLPATWDDILSLAPLLKRRNMEFGMMVGYQGYLQLLYQHGGSLYQEDGIHTALGSNEAMAAFEQLCNLFTQYKLPIEYNAANRFRSGEMPVVIADYAFYNQLVVFAPEIGGLWEMAPIPGVRQEDGSVNNTAVATTTSAVILRSTDKAEEAWEFLKWWTSAETQIRFGVEMEAVLGPSAKQPTANLEALSELPWTVKEFTALRSQQAVSSGIPIVPGYYQAERLVGFAFNDVYNDNTSPVEELEDILTSIDQELERKYEEFVGQSGRERR